MLKYRDKTYETLPGESWHDACVRLGLKDVLAVQAGGLPEGLSLPAEGDAAALTYRDEEGRRVYERSLRFVLLLAASRILPGAHLRIENSYGSGVLVTVRNAVLSELMVKKLEARKGFVQPVRVRRHARLFLRRNGLRYLLRERVRTDARR